MKVRLPRPFSVAVLAVACVLATAGRARPAENWPQFRGHGGQGVAENADLPLHWDENTNVLWKTPVHGKAWSSPVVWGDQVWLTTATEDGHQLGVVCLDRASGRIVRDQTLFDVAHPQYCHPFNSYASPSPVIEEGRVYVSFGSPGTACLDTSNGKVLWERTDFVCNHYRGAGSSPALFGDLLVLHFDGSDFQYVVALDKHTGRTVWKTDRSVDYGDVQPDGKPLAEGDFRKSFATPRFASFDGRNVLLSLGSKAMYAYAPLTGKELWRTDFKDSFSGSDTPVVGRDLIYFTTGHGQSELVALKPDGSIAWRIHKHVPTRSSVLLADDLLYMTSDAGVVSILDPQTGKELAHGRIDGEYSASPIAAPGRVYFFNQSGKTTVLAAGKEFKVLAENQLSDGIMATPAAAGNDLFIRTRTALYRVGPRERP